MEQELKNLEAELEKCRAEELEKQKMLNELLEQEKKENLESQKTAESEVQIEEDSTFSYIRWSIAGIVFLIKINIK